MGYPTILQAVPIFARGAMMRMLVAGEWRNASDGGEIDVVDPGTGELIDTVPVATEEDIARVIEGARHGRKSMAAMPAHERSAILTRGAQRLEDEHEAVARMLAQENGKPIRQTREEVSAAARIIRGFGEEAKRIFGRQVPMDAVPGHEQHVAFTIRQPVGVVFAVAPFNYPLERYAHKVAAGLGAGNAVIGKPPSACPLTLLYLARILEEAGLPPGAHQMVTGSGSRVGPPIAASPEVQMVSVTGSVETGAELGRICAETMKPFHAELGGNDATIVCADADLELAASGVVLSRLARGNGQICCSVKRVLVDRRVVHDFTEIIADKAAALRVAYQLSEDSDVGPLITEAAARQVIARVEEAVAAGAILVGGGAREGPYVAPTVLGDVPVEVPLFREETFGPVVPIVAFDDVDQAVAMANDSPYGLQASLFTKDVNTALRVAYRLEAGGVIINWGSAVRSEILPFGGLKLTGHGRESVHDTMLSMTEQKVVLFYGALAAQELPASSSL
jgi:acyl-CoA reductase-like NAD-dependent aldehyde dehydrogenase